MKKNRFLWALLLLVSLGAAAQDNIHFVAGTPTQKGLSQKNMDALKLKVEQIIARNTQSVHYAGVTGAMVNTILVMGGIFVLYKDAYAKALSVDAGVLESSVVSSA